MTSPVDDARAVRPRLADTRADVEALLATRLTRVAELWSADAAVPDPVLGDADVPRLLRDLALGGGKRLRPLFVHAGWALAGGASSSYDEVVRLGAALELLHAFGLVQDDVMDRSDTRRGAPAVHRRVAALHRDACSTGDHDRYGESVAVLVGDLAHAEAADLVAELPEAVRRAWHRLCLELVRGQTRDLSFAACAGDRVDLDRAWEVARAKSGAYTVQRPLELGGLLAGAPKETQLRLSQVGRLLGEAFALRDELAGAWGDPALTGKPVGDDLRQGKATVLLALAGDRLLGGDAEALRRLLSQTHDESDVTTVSEAMLRHRVRADAEEMITMRVAAAHDLLHSPELDPAGVSDLAEVTDLVTGAAS